MNYLIKGIIIFLFLGHFYLGDLGAQINNKLWFHQLGEKQGVSIATKIYEFFQDSEDFIWIGTESGLDRFDGKSLVHYLPDPSDSTSLSGPTVYGRFYEDADKNIWFCNLESIQCYNRINDNFSTFHVYDSRGLKVKTNYKALFLERDSLLWVSAGERNIYSFNIKTKKPSSILATTSFDINIFPGASESRHLKYLFAVDGGKTPGIEVFNLQENKTNIVPQKYFGDSIPGKPILGINEVLFESDTLTWLVSDKSLYKWNLLTGNIQLYHSTHEGTISFTLYDEENFLVTNYKSSAYLLNKKTKNTRHIELKLLSDPQINLALWINEPLIDNKGNIWISTKEKGLLYCNPRKIKFQSIPKPPIWNEKENYAFRTMISDKRKRSWISTRIDGVYLLGNEKNIIYHFNPKHPKYKDIPSYQVNHMILSTSEKLWIATTMGVAYFDEPNARFITILDENGKAIYNPTYLCQLSNGDILVSTLQNGIFRINSKNNIFFLEQVLPPSGPNEFFTTIYEDKLGSIYISKEMAQIAIYNYSKNQLQFLHSKPIKGYINGFHEDSDGKTLWIATTMGIAKVDKTNLNQPHRILSNKKDLKQNEIQSMLLDNNGYLWLATSGGLVRFDKEKENFFGFSIADGTQSSQFHMLAAMCNDDGTLWFGGNNGITIVDPEKIKPIETQPKIHITEILVNDQIDSTLEDANTKATNVITFSGIRQPFRDNTLSFSFVAIDYSDPHSTQLMYKMDNYEKDWIELKKGEKGFARYPKLPPGHYTFMIKAANSDGIWSGEIRELSIVIRPPWYRTWLAITLFILAALGLIYAYYRYRVRQIQKAEAFKRKEAEFKQKVAETETAILRLQMNPHFIFNSMNSISSYIVQKDIETANNYLHRFAKLMRTILKQAEKPFLSIYDEQDLLEQYLLTESMRFEDTIHYEFKLSKGLDPDEYIIPTMILQPFIENAIWHGLAKKEGEKKIIIGFEVKEDQLICSVEDNGIGRKAATDFKSSSSTHESKAIKITKRRLEILEEKEQRPTDLKIIDLKNEKGQAIGTKVQITLPVL